MQIVDRDVSVDGAAADRALLDLLRTIPELELSGFNARSGLTGTGVTVMRGRSYFGSWRTNGEGLTWTNVNGDLRTAVSIDDAARQTLLLILRSLEMSMDLRGPRAMTA